jgi:hypothetical protein
LNAAMNTALLPSKVRDTGQTNVSQSLPQTAWRRTGDSKSIYTMVKERPKHAWSLEYQECMARLQARVSTWWVQIYANNLMNITSRLFTLWLILLVSNQQP